MVSTTPSSTTCRWSRSWVSRRVRRWVGNISRKWISRHFSRTSPPSMSSWSPCRHRCDTWWIVRCVSRSPNAQSPASSFPTIFRKRKRSKRRRACTAPCIRAWASAPRVVPTDHDLQQAADLLNAGSKVAILAGAGALGASEEVMEVAELLGAGVAKALLGKAALPDELPFVTGSIGLLGTKPSWELMTECDTLLMIGSRFPYSEFLPKEGQARGVQIDIDPAMLSIRYPMEIYLVGDATATLQALIPRLQRKTDRE